MGGVICAKNWSWSCLFGLIVKPNLSENISMWAVCKWACFRQAMVRVNKTDAMSIMNPRVCACSQMSFLKFFNIFQVFLLEIQNSTVFQRCVEDKFHKTCELCLRQNGFNAQWCLSRYFMWWRHSTYDRYKLHEFETWAIWIDEVTTSGLTVMN